MFDIEPHSIRDRLRCTFTTAISRFGRAVGLYQNQIIVCGYPRGGTSLFYNMLSTTLATKYRFEQFEKYFIFNIHKIGNIATKAPLDIFHLKYLDELNVHNKNVFVFVILRDIREVVTSRHPFLPNEYFIGYDHSWWPQNGDFNEWKYDAPGVISISEELEDISQRSDVMMLKYEDIVESPDVVQKRIMNNFKLEFMLPFSRYHENATKLAYEYTGKYEAKDQNLVLEGKPVKTKKARWCQPEHRERIVQQFTNCPELFDVLIKQGYEKDTQWFERYMKYPGSFCEK